MGKKRDAVKWPRAEIISRSTTRPPTDINKVVFIPRSSFLYTLSVLGGRSPPRLRMKDEKENSLISSGKFIVQLTKKNHLRTDQPS